MLITLLLMKIMISLPVSANQMFSFIALGDTQDISDIGVNRINRLIASINQREHDFVVHIGEFKGGTADCNNEYYQRIVDTSNRSVKPLIYLPGDNDWTDCFNSDYEPTERLAYLRRILYPNNHSLGKTTQMLNRQHQANNQIFYPENVWWQHHDITFSTFHNVGTNNNLYSSDTATQEHLARNNANLEWLEIVFEQAKSSKALVIFTHANIKFGTKSWEATGFDSFRKALQAHTLAYRKPVLFIHGDTHAFKIDKPMKIKNKAVSNFTRLEVFGSPDLGMIEVFVDPNSDRVFSFLPYSYPFEHETNKQ